MPKIWQHPYPEEDRLAYVLCGDPVAVTYRDLEIWLQEQNYKPCLTMEELIEALSKISWGMSFIDILRNGNFVIGEDLPYILYVRVLSMIKGTLV